MFQTIVQTVFYEFVLPNSAAAAVLILLILLFRQVTGRLSKGYVRALWILLLVQLLAPPLFQSPFYTVRDLPAGLFSTSKDGQNSSDTGTAVAGAQADRNGNKADSIIANEMENHMQKEPPKNAAGAVLSGADTGIKAEQTAALHKGAAAASRLLVWIWLFGAVVCFACEVYAFVRIKRKVKGAVYVPEQGVWELCTAVTPFVLPGIVPRIYLPMGMEQQHREAVLAHERQHMKNLDPLLKCVAVFAAVVYWFHPLVWAAVSMFEKDMEMYCDECVLRGKGLKERKAYSALLLEFAVKSCGMPLTMQFGKSNTERRILHILQVKKPGFAGKLLLAGMIAAGSVAFLSAKDVQHTAAADESRQAPAEPGEQGWQALALSYGMNQQQAQRWYQQFAKDGLCTKEQESVFTGCAYEDVDGNGSKDLFIIVARRPQQADAKDGTMDIYGYINGNLAYSKNFDASAENGFLQFEAKPSAHPAFDGEVRYTVDLGGGQEERYLVRVDGQGAYQEQCLSDSDRVLRLLQQVPAEAYEKAGVYEEGGSNKCKAGGVLLLAQEPDAGLRVYGYKSKAYGERGMIVDYQGTRSYFDFAWSSWRYGPVIAAGDFDGDSALEFAFTYLDAYGTGVMIHGLRVFEVQDDHSLVCFELDTDMFTMQKKLDPFIRFDKKTGKAAVVRDGKTVEEVDFSKSPDYVGHEDEITISCSTWTAFEVKGDRIFLETALLGVIDTPTLYMNGIEAEESRILFEVLYKEGEFTYFPVPDLQ